MQRVSLRPRATQRKKSRRLSTSFWTNYRAAASCVTDYGTRGGGHETTSRIVRNRVRRHFGIAATSPLLRGLPLGEPAELLQSGLAGSALCGALDRGAGDGARRGAAPSPFALAAVAFRSSGSLSPCKDRAHDALCSSGDDRPIWTPGWPSAS